MNTKMSPMSDLTPARQAVLHLESAVNEIVAAITKMEMGRDIAVIRIHDNLTSKHIDYMQELCSDLRALIIMITRVYQIPRPFRPPPSE